MVTINLHRHLYSLYQSLPPGMKRIARQSYNTYVDSGVFGPSYRRDFITQFFDSEAEFEEYEREFHRSDITSVVEDARREHEERTGHGRFAAINQYTPARLYALVRKLQPETIVETGVCNGVSTYVILKALEENGSGSLHSVDYPEHDRIPDGEESGWIIPDDLRHRWSLTTGLSQEELPGVVAELDSIDLFIHDTKAAILDDELDIVWPLLSAGTPIIADDVHVSDVFGQIQREYPVDAGHLAPNVGYLVKQRGR